MKKVYVSSIILICISTVLITKYILGILSKRDIEYSSSFQPKIDVVYMWLNHSDHAYQLDRAKYEKNTDHTYSPSIDHGELKISIRSLFRFGATWLGDIYIVSNDGILPSWIDEKNGRIISVDSNELIRKMGGASPNFNSHAIVSAFHTIPTLREHFLGMDDDFILVRHTTFDDFYYQQVHEKFPRTIVKRKCSGAKNGLVAQCEGTRKIMGKIQSFWPSHTVRPFLKSRLLELECGPFGSYLRETRRHRFRDPYDIDITGLYPWYVQWKYNNTHTISSGNRHNWMIDSRVITDLNDPMWKKYGKRPLTNLVLEDSRASYQSYMGPAHLYMFTRKYKLGLPSPVEKKKYLPKTQIMGHRGFGVDINTGVLTHPESSMKSIQSAVGVIGWVEIDVALTKDRKVIVTHAHKYLHEKCSDQSVRTISNMTYAEIQKSFTRVPPLLEELLKKFRHRIGFQIELKQNTNYAKAKKCLKSSCVPTSHDPLASAVYVLLNKYRVNKNVIVSSFDVSRLQYFVKRGIQTVVTFPMFGSPEPYIQKIHKVYNITYISVSYDFMKKQKTPISFAPLKLQIGMPGGSWCMHEQKKDTFESHEQIKHALTFGPDILITNKPLIGTIYNT